MPCASCLYLSMSDFISSDFPAADVVVHVRRHIRVRRRLRRPRRPDEGPSPAEAPAAWDPAPAGGGAVAADRPLLPRPGASHLPGLQDLGEAGGVVPRSGGGGCGGVDGGAAGEPRSARCADSGRQWREGTYVSFFFFLTFLNDNWLFVLLWLFDG